MQSKKTSAKPSKQRKMLFQAPGHIRHRHFSAHVSSELRASHGIRTIPLRTGDTVRITRGDHEGFEGKVTRIDKKDYRIYVEGLTREKVDGTTIFLPIHPSKTLITKLNLDDRWRKRILERRKSREEPEPTPEKPILEEDTKIATSERSRAMKKTARKRRKTAEIPAAAKQKKTIEKKTKRKTIAKRAKSNSKRSKSERKTPTKRGTARKTKGGKRSG